MNETDITRNSPKKLSYKELRTGLWFGIFFVIVGILVLIADSNFNKNDYYGDKPESCFSNQRKIEEAIKSFNTTNNINKFKTVYPGGDFEKLEEILVRERYLNKYIELPTENCSYGFITIKNEGTVFCKYHGTEKSKTIPEYDKSKEKPISLQLYQYKKDLRKDRQSKYSTLIVIRGILDPTALISIGLIFIALVIDKILQRRKR